MLESRSNLTSRELVSIIMPVRNEAEYIERSLESIFKQDYPHDLIEIIIADGMSSDETKNLIQKARSQTEIPVKVIDNPAKIAPCALNLAIAASSGSIIVRVDGHCEIASDYITNCVELLRSGKADGVGGPIETVAESPKSAAIAISMSSKFGVGGSAFRTVKNQELEVDTVAFPGYKRDLFVRLGGFNEELIRNQDDEFNFRIRENGGKIILTPKIQSRYYSRNNFWSLWKQYFQYGYWKVRVFQLHPKQMSFRQFVPPAFVVVLLMFLVFAPISKISIAGLVAVSGLYLAANLGAAFTNCIKSRIALFPGISLAFAVLHFSYGIGFLAGLLVFRKQWRNKSEATAVIPSAQA